jgi:Phosphoesterase family
MKRISVSFLILGVCLVSVAWSQSLPVAFTGDQTIPPGAFKHIIIVIQENRTPDNLFGAGAPRLPGCGGDSPHPFEPRMDISNAGAEHGYPSQFCNVQQPMNNGTTFDPGHFYGDWVADFNSGAMDGFCHDKTGAYSLSESVWSITLFVRATIRRSALLGHRQGIRFRQLYVSDQRRPELPGASVAFHRHFRAGCA